MHCNVCNYRLWNLKIRQCPECGTSFRPRDYEFVVNSVQFCCPHCDQDYYGVGQKGHLVPDEFACVRCGRQVDMDQMVLRPTVNIKEEQTQVDQNPWLKRQQQGRVRSWFATLGRSMVAPTRLIAATPEASSVGHAIRFMLTTSLLTYLGTALPIMVLFTVMSGGLATMIPGTSQVTLGTVWRVVWVATITVLVALVVNLALFLFWGLATHGILRLGGRPAGGLGRTFHALSYSCGPLVVLAVPCLGLYLLWFGGIIWWMVGGILMVKEGQQVHPGRATMAVLCFPLTLAALLIAAWIGMILIAIY